MLIRPESASSALAEGGSAHVVSGNNAFCTRRRLINGSIVWRRGIDMFDTLAPERLAAPVGQQSYLHAIDNESSSRTNLYGVCISDTS